MTEQKRSSKKKRVQITEVPEGVKDDIVVEDVVVEEAPIVEEVLVVESIPEEVVVKTMSQPKAFVSSQSISFDGLLVNQRDESVDGYDVKNITTQHHQLYIVPIVKDGGFGAAFALNDVFGVFTYVHNILREDRDQAIDDMLGIVMSDRKIRLDLYNGTLEQFVQEARG